MSLGIPLLILSAAAADYPPSGEAEESIIVTGERIARPLRETDASVAIFDSRRLRREPEADRLDDLWDLAANVVSGTPGQGPAIRGQDTTGPLVNLAAFLGGTRPRMALNIDGRAASFNELVFGAAPLWDVAQVEIFRTPQSTVEGRNSIAGATYVRTKSPTNEFEGAARLSLDNRGGRQVSTMVNAPLIDNRLAVRLALDGRRGRPWSRLGGLQAGADPTADDHGIFRAKLLATPDAVAGSRFELSFQHLRSQAPQTVTYRPALDRRRDFGTTYGIFGNRITSATLRAAVPLLPSLDSQTIVSFGYSRFRRFAPPGVGEALNLVSDRSLETRLDWKPRAGWSLRGGIHTLTSNLDQDIDLSAIVGSGSFKDRQVALGVFGEAEVELGNGWSALASLRRQQDRQRRSGGIHGLLEIPLDYDRTFAFWLPHVALRWDVNDGVRVGASMQRASNPGGVSVNFITGGPEVLDAETLWNAELFARARLLGGRVELAANLFRNRHHSAQRALPRNFLLATRATLTWYELFNVDQAVSEGLEAEFKWEVNRNVRVRGSLGLLRTRLHDHATSFDGKLFSRAPARTATLEGEWSPLEPLTFKARLRYHSGYFSDDLNLAALHVKGAAEADLSAFYRIGRTILSGYVRNLSDEFLPTFYSSPTVAVPNRPREIGLGLETQF